MASPNSITLATKFLPILDEIYRREALTARMDAPTKPIDFVDAKTVKIFKIGLVGLGNYDKTNGYPTASMSGTWETMTLAQDRAREFDVDRMDDEESLNQAFGRLVGEFMRTQVIPEIDAYRFATYAGWSGVGAATPAALANTTTLAAIDTAMQVMDDAEVPSEGRILFASSTIYMYLKQQITRLIGNKETGVDRTVEMFDRVEIVRVPAARFYTQVTLDAGTNPATGGYTKTASTGRNINFLLVHPSAVLQATKLAMPKIFSPDENQTADAWKYQHRHYHDAFVYDNKVAGVYVHASTS
jgi:hypothetical protein